MSQKKVDAYKKEKQNRKKIMAREKRKNFLMKFAGILITLLFFGFIIYSGYDKWIKPEEEVKAETYALSDKEVESLFNGYEEYQASKDASAGEVDKDDASGGEVKETTKSEETEKEEETTEK